MDRGVTLYGSRDPKVYEVMLPETTPGDAAKCGTSLPRPGQFGTEAGMEKVASLRRGGCRPLIAATNVTDAAVMGAGTIDGRGLCKVAGQGLQLVGDGAASGAKG